jgi:chitodextrinase
MVLGGVGEGTGVNAENELVRVERVWWEEGNGARVDNACAREKNTERSNVGTLRGVEEQERRNTAGQMENRGMHQGKSLFIATHP